MRVLFFFFSLFISARLFSQTNINFFEAITKKSIDQIDAQLSDLGYNLTKSDSVQKFYTWKNQDEDSFTYQKGWFKVSKQSKGNGQESITLQPQLIFKFISSDRNKYYSIQASLNSSTSYLKNSPTQTKSGIKTTYKNGEINVVLEKIILENEGELYRITFIVSHPK